MQSPIIDLDELSEQAHYHLQNIQPHYRIFLGNAKRAGMNNVSDYIHMFYGGLVKGIEAIRSFIENEFSQFSPSNPPTELDIKRISQKIQAANYLDKAIDKSMNEFSKAVKKAGKPSEAEKKAYRIVGIFMSKLIINQAVTNAPHPLVTATLKTFILQYYSDYNSLYDMDGIPKTIIEHVEKIVAPSFDDALKNVLEQNRSRGAKIECDLPDDQLRIISKRVSKNYTGNPMDFFRAIRDGEHTKWKSSPEVLALLIYTMKTKNFLSSKVNRGHFTAAQKLFLDYNHKSTKKIRLSELSSRIYKSLEKGSKRFEKENKVVATFLYGISL